MLARVTMIQGRPISFPGFLDDRAFNLVFDGTNYSGDNMRYVLDGSFGVVTAFTMSFITAERS